MADVPDSGTVVDGRTPAKGLLPKHTLVWLLVGFAAVLTLVSVVTNLRATRAPKPVVEKVSAENPKQLEHYRTQLDADAERARAMASTKPPAPLDDPAKKTTRQGGTGTVSFDTAGVSSDTRAKREHDSLFASTMVVSRHPVAEASSGPSGRPGSAGPSAMDASLDDTVAAVLRAAKSQAPVPSPQLTAPVLPGADTQHTVAPPGKEKVGPVRTPPIAATGPMHLLLESTVLDGTLVDKLEGSNDSPVKALISGPVFSHNRQFVLIPDGTFAVGRAKAVQQYNETRLAVSFHRLEFPDGSTVSLDQYQGLDQAGDVGLHDKVNNHYLATFGRAAAVGILQGLGQRVGSSGFGGNGDNRTVVIEGVGNSTSSAFTTLLNRMPLPTIEIRPGHRLKIYLTSDLELPAWSRTGEVRPVR
jgi:type IV secretory pathway VirB10-like protein